MAPLPQSPEQAVPDPAEGKRNWNRPAEGGHDWGQNWNTTQAPRPVIIRQDFRFFNTLANGKYYYIDIFHPAYWRTQTLTAILFPLVSLILLLLVFYIRSLYVRNQDYRERIEAQKNLVVLGSAASTLAHEIKNPLLSIRLQTGILDKVFDEKGREELGIINEEVDRLSALSYRINDYIRDAAGQPEPINSYTALRETSLRLCGRDCVAPDAVRDGMVFLDPDRLRSVFENLFRNALESGGSEADVGAAIARNGSRLHITICDRGRGISPEDLKRVFDPFFTRKSVGTGIGLCISKRFVEAAKGTITLENREGGGALVRIALPEYGG
jgi:two-component system sensor histidine kinase HydH